MFTISAVYTAPAIVDDVTAAFEELYPEGRIINIIDGGLIKDIIKAGKVTDASARRLLNCYSSAVDAGVDLILNTCSSVGDIVEHAQCFISVPIIKIDAPMVRLAIEKGERIAVLATLPTTLSPTVRLVESEAAQRGRKIQVVEGLAEGAYEALVSGNRAEHNRILLETAKRVADESDVIVLAQGSMARMEDEIYEMTNKPVLSSIRSGLKAIGEYRPAKV